MAEPDPDRTLPTNGQLARIFHEIGDMLEVKGELVFKTVAYHRAADAIARSPFDVAGAYAAGDRPKIGGVGQAISDKIAELVDDRPDGDSTSGSRRRSRRPSSSSWRCPGVGPRTVRLLYETLGIENLEDLRQAAEAGRLRTVKGLSEKTEQQVLEGIAALENRPRPPAHPRASALVENLADGAVGVAGRPASGAGGLVPPTAGDDRRPRPAGGDRRRPGDSSSAFTGLGAVDGVINKGGYKAAVQLLRGPQVDLMVMPPGEAGTYLIHFTGSKEHNVRLRARARDGAGACRRRASSGSARTASR